MLHFIIFCLFLCCWVVVLCVCVCILFLLVFLICAVSFGNLKNTKITHMFDHIILSPCLWNVYGDAICTVQVE